MKSPYGPGRCAYCSEPATGLLDRTPVCGSCNHMMRGEATSLRGVENRDAKSPEELRRRRRAGGEGRWKQR